MKSLVELFNWIMNENKMPSCLEENIFSIGMVENKVYESYNESVVKNNREKVREEVTIRKNQQGFIPGKSTMGLILCV